MLEYQEHLRQLQRIGKGMKIFLSVLLILTSLLVAAYLIVRTERETLNDKVRATASGKFIRLKNGLVHYELGGDKNNPLVVLVHGFSTPAYTWDPNFQTLIDAGFSVLRFDLYGRGYSDRPNTAYDLSLFVSQLEQLLDALQVDQPVHLLGLSMGGPIVTEYANHHTESIQSLVLMDPLVTNMFTSAVFPLNLPGIGEYLMAVVMEPFVLPQSQSGDLVHPENFPEWEDKYREQIQYKGFGRAILSTMRNLAKLDTLKLYENLAKKELPTLIIWGKQDQTISAEDITLLREMLPKHQSEPIDDAGHIPHYEQPQDVNKVLINYFRSNNSNN